MKLLLMSDLHIDKKKPEYRTDVDYVETIFTKLEWAFDLCLYENIRYVLIAGDIFEDYKPPYYLVNRFIAMLDNYELELLVVPGQHDQRFHTKDLTNTTLGLLDLYPRIHILGTEPFPDLDDIHIYGAGWGDRIPKIQNPDALNVLVTHRMIVKDKLWEGQEAFTQANIFLRTSKFNLNLSGDNHKTFEILGTKKALINCGSLMRTRTNQHDHEPCVWIFNTLKSDDINECLKKYYIPVEAGEDVMDLEQSAVDKSKNKDLDSYINRLKEVKAGSKEFVNSLDYFVSENDVEQGVVDFINECKPKEQV
jgi:predicted phosphodiesterase